MRVRAFTAGFHEQYRQYALLTPQPWLEAVDGGAVRQVCIRPSKLTCRTAPFAARTPALYAWRIQTAGCGAAAACLHPAIWVICGTLSEGPRRSWLPRCWTRCS